MINDHTTQYNPIQSVKINSAVAVEQKNGKTKRDCTEQLKYILF